MAAHSMDFMGWFAVTKYSTGSDSTKSWSSTVSNGIRFNIEHATDFQRIPFDSAAHYLGQAIQTRSSLGASGIARLLWTCEVFDGIPSHRKTVVPNDIQQAIHVCIVTKKKLPHLFVIDSVGRFHHALG